MKRSHQEAMTTSDDFMPTDEIMRIVYEIQADPSTETVRFNKYKTRYADFATRYPNLFMSCCAPDFDINRLEYMLRMKNAVDNRRITQEAASAQIGEKMFNQYVKPIVDEQSKQNEKK